MKALIISFQSLTKDTAGGTGRIAYSIASRLYDRGDDVKLVVSSKGKHVTKFPSVPAHSLSRYYLWIINRLFAYGLVSTFRKRYVEEWLFDYFCQSNVRQGYDLVISTNCYLKRTFRRCAALGIKTVLIPGNPADTEIFDLLKIEMQKWQVDATDAYTFRPRLEYYRRTLEIVDTIICHTGVIDESFSRQFPNKARRRCLGIIHDQTSPRQKEGKNPGSSPFVILYVGYTVILKGLQYLLRGWTKLPPSDCELWIVGSIDSSVQIVIDREFSNMRNVKFLGIRYDVDELYKRADLVVVPSLLDGGPVTVFEAMSWGVPVLLTTGCGAKDIVEDEQNGFIVKAGDSEAIAEVIQRCLSNRVLTTEVGTRGMTTLRGHRYDGFIDRLIEQALNQGPQPLK